MVYDSEPIPYDYAAVENYAWADHDPARTRRTLQLLLPFVGETALEIGCGRGGLLKALSAHTKVMGMDPSRANVEECLREHLDVVCHGIDWLTEAAQFDLIIMCHVLEHLTDVPGSLRKIYESLTPSGYCYIEVPDATRHLDHMTVPMQEFSREHINHFSPALLAEAISLAGLSIVTTGTRSIAYPSCGMYPAIYIVAQRKPTVALHDPLLPRLMREYARQSEARLQTMAEQVGAQLKGEPYTVWGAGVLAEHLVPLLPQPLAIVDRDAGKHGSVIHGRKVTPPPPSGNSPIFVCSIIGRESILWSIRERGLQNRVILL